MVRRGTSGIMESAFDEAMTEKYGERGTGTREVQELKYAFEILGESLNFIGPAFLRLEKENKELKEVNKKLKEQLNEQTKHSG